MLLLLAVLTVLAPLQAFGNEKALVAGDKESLIVKAAKFEVVVVVLLLSLPITTAEQFHQLGMKYVFPSLSWPGAGSLGNQFQQQGSL